MFFRAIVYRSPETTWKGIGNDMEYMQQNDRKEGISMRE